MINLIDPPIVSSCFRPRLYNSIVFSYLNHIFSKMITIIKNQTNFRLSLTSLNGLYESVNTHWPMNLSQIKFLFHTWILIPFSGCCLKWKIVLIFWTLPYFDVKPEKDYGKIPFWKLTVFNHLGLVSFTFTSDKRKLILQQKWWLFAIS